MKSNTLNELKEPMLPPTPAQQIEERVKTADRVFGMTIHLIGLVFVCIHNALVKKVQTEHSEFTMLEGLTLRSFFQFLLGFGMMKVYGLSFAHIEQKDIKLLILRSVLSQILYLFSFFSLKYLSVGLYQTIINTMPLFVLIFAFLFLSERLQKIEIVNIVVSFLATISLTLSSSSLDAGHSEATLFMIACIVAIATAIIMALLIVLISSMRDVHASVIQAFNALFGLVFGSILIFINRTILGKGYNFTFSSSDYLILLILGLSAAIYQYLFTHALKFEKSGRLASISFMTIVFGYASDVVQFNYTLSTFEVTAITAISMCSVFIFCLKYKSFSK